ncbi:type VI secretion system baseplate subunit TssF [Pseudoduganella umbonata]|uniref:Type VI secretion system baseplate subunit TssF n=1 Tax=Pseudoduganella umbonata TaxID=864828 RepID=A0A4P8HPZ8_9BURK|nr:type VI secretion system baseplate subunit TssF [Pseudoduganella umbonata]MBB3221232.1 type VI secretion system protein ImpG [Pseudoduganella umbonata]QCP10415.1 type VI secretion system baseplate subunit TssF [Pseudoduganella umbonata]
MNPDLLRAYEAELQHLRGMGGEFARDFPKIAGRLGLETEACADPYVERLLEGVSFLAARVHLKIDAEYPRFTNHLLELVYPHYLAPTPSMAVVQLQPDMTEGSLAQGYTVTRGSALHGMLGKGDQTVCEFRSAHDVTLWPVELVQARYAPCGQQLDGIDLAPAGAVKAALRLRLRAGAGLAFADLALDALPLFLRGSEAIPGRLLEQLLAHAAGIVVMPGQGAAPHAFVPPAALRPLGCAEHEALLPNGPRTFEGYRLLQEYFALPQRFMFVELGGLGAALRGCPGNEVEIAILLRTFDPVLEHAVDAATFGLYCTPAINLFPRQADRIHLSERQAEFHVVPDRTRPMDFEVYQVLGVKGYGSGSAAVQAFQSFYRANDLQGADAGAYYQVRRDARVLSARQQREGARSGYVGSEVFLALVDAGAAPWNAELRQLGVETLCTNRDLVLGMPLGAGRTDFTLGAGAPVRSVRCVAGPSLPAPSHAQGETAWRLASHLSLNYLSLLDGPGDTGAAALRDMLRLYCARDDLAAQRQIDGLRSVRAEAVVRRLPLPGPASFGRGLQVGIEFDDAAFTGGSVFLLGMLLEQFFAKYVSLNSFTETHVRTAGRGLVMAWPARVGRCATL